MLGLAKQLLSFIYLLVKVNKVSCQKIMPDSVIFWVGRAGRTNYQAVVEVELS